MVRNPSANAGDIGDAGSIPGLGRSPGGRHSILAKRIPWTEDPGRLQSAAAKSLQSCPTLCNPIDGSPPGSPIPGILQPRTLQWVALPSPMRESEVAQSYLTLSDPVDCSPPGSSIHGILQATVLEWGAIAFSVDPGCYHSNVN